MIKFNKPEITKYSDNGTIEYTESMIQHVSKCGKYRIYRFYSDNSYTVEFHNGMGFEPIEFGIRGLKTAKEFVNEVAK